MGIEFHSRLEIKILCGKFIQYVVAGIGVRHIYYLHNFKLQYVVLDTHQPNYECFGILPLLENLFILEKGNTPLTKRFGKQLEIHYVKIMNIVPICMYMLDWVDLMRY